MPKRSRSCGLSSPSSGFPLPIKMNLAGWQMEMPSRSTVFHPEAAESRSTSTRWSSRRLTSSTYRIPRLALARSPGSNALVPSVRAFSMSMVPHTRSSVAPRGRSTMLMGTLAVSMVSPRLYRASTSGAIKFGSVGEDMNASSLTMSIRGRRSTSARTVVDFPVPRSPITMIPPMFGSMMFIIAANFISSWPMIALNGYTGRAAASVSTAAGSATALVATRRTGFAAAERAVTFLPAFAAGAANAAADTLVMA
mmetsp:Transcript_6204/g.20791  ORF Transcript_6204/g.20791 Transcript_6204/m.20791 type:complete len:253 (+) Transcript_6204:1594-2352(+)